MEYVENFEYLGRIINNHLIDDDDILWEVRSLSVRGNILIRKFSFCTFDVLCYLFKTFLLFLILLCFVDELSKTILYSLRVCYNNIMRRLIGVQR